MLRLLLAILPATILSSCFVGVENQIQPDEKVDKRLVGVWTVIPLHNTEEEEEASWETEDPRNDDDIGFNSYLIFGDAGNETLEIFGIDRFEPDGGSTVIVGNAGRTRKFKERQYILFNSTADEHSEKGDESTPPNFVLEYAFEKDGSLRLWFIFVDELSEAIKLHPMELGDEKIQFGTVTIKGSSQEILEFYSDPKVAKTMVSAGRYQKLKLPKNARIAGKK